MSLPELLPIIIIFGALAFIRRRQPRPEITEDMAPIERAAAGFFYILPYFFVMFFAAGACVVSTTTGALLYLCGTIVVFVAWDHYRHRLQPH